MDQLKKALLKAGFATKDQLSQKERRPRQKKALNAEEKGHEIRTQCQLCDAFTNDIEYYEHADRRISTKWLCVNCADQHQIDDATRQTHQSPNSRSGSFNRRYGRTRRFG